MAMISPEKQPHILLLTDVRGWALDSVARAIERHLSDRYAITILAAEDRPIIEESAYDIVHVLYEYERWHRPFLHGHARVVRSVFSHYWEQRGMSPREFYDTYLTDGHAITVPSLKLLHALREVPKPLVLFPEGVDTDTFRPVQRRQSGPLVVGWAGNPTREIKRLPLLRAACEGVAKLRIADGSLDEQAMVSFYNDVDIIACTSIAEGCPRPILEGMACGTFPVSYDVGIVPELVEDGLNGCIVRQQGVAAFRSTLSQCVAHPEHIRRAGALNPERVRADRQWRQTVQALVSLYDGLLSA